MTETLEVNKYPDFAFLPKKAVESFNRIIDKFGLEVVFNDSSIGNLFADEFNILAQFEKEALIKEDISDIYEISKAINRQLIKFINDKVYFVYADSVDSPEISVFLKLGHIYDGI